MVVTDRMIKRREQARELRGQGMTYQEIANKIGVSNTMARHYVIGRKSANDRSAGDHQCKIFSNGRRCERHAGHFGVHLSNGEDGRLTYWE